MAKCEEGYLCEVCGEDVESISSSDLYLRYVIGLVDPETLHTQKERHINCNPSLAQFIVAEEFPAVCAEAPFDKSSLDPTSVSEREELVTRGWNRLREIEQNPMPLLEYPLDEVREQMRRDYGESSASD